MVDLSLLTAPAILMTASSRLKTKENPKFQLKLFLYMLVSFLPALLASLLLCHVGQQFKIQPAT